MHPELEEVEKFEKSLGAGLQAMYSTTEKLKKNFHKVVIAKQLFLTYLITIKLLKLLKMLGSVLIT